MLGEAEVVLTTAGSTGGKEAESQAVGMLGWRNYERRKVQQGLRSMGGGQGTQTY